MERWMEGGLMMVMMMKKKKKTKNDCAVNIYPSIRNRWTSSSWLAGALR